MPRWAARIAYAIAVLIGLVRKVTQRRYLRRSRAEAARCSRPRSITPRKQRCRRLWPASRRPCLLRLPESLVLPP